MDGVLYIYAQAATIAKKEEHTMKKLVCLVLTLMLTLCAMIPALAESPEAPENSVEPAAETGFQAPTMLDASDLAGVPTHYLLYDREFYEAPAISPAPWSR